MPSLWSLRVRVSFSLLLQINDLRSQKTPIESLFIEATEKFRSNLKTMYSVPVCAAPGPGEGPCGDPRTLSRASPHRLSIPRGSRLHPRRMGRFMSATRT